MVVHEEFAVARIPRTGTDASSLYFKILARQGLHLRILFDDGHEKHHPFAWVPESYDKLHVLTIRRLPCFMLSYLNMCATTGIYPQYIPLPTPSKDDVLDVNRLWGYVFNYELPGPLANIGDRYIRHMTSDFLFPVDHCLRMEFLEEDIYSFVSKYMKRVIPVHLNKELSPYNHDPMKVWTPDEIAIMYANNPEWTALERRYYKSILIGG